MVFITFFVINMETPRHVIRRHHQSGTLIIMIFTSHLLKDAETGK
jgi:hypothetical protein